MFKNTEHDHRLWTAKALQINHAVTVLHEIARQIANFADNEWSSIAVAKCLACQQDCACIATFIFRIWPHITDLSLSEPSALWCVTTVANWVASQCTIHFIVRPITVHSVQMKWGQLKWSQMKWDATRRMNTPSYASSQSDDRGNVGLLIHLFSNALNLASTHTWLCLIRTNKKHLKNVGPIRHCEPPLHWHSPGVATVARQL